MNNIFLNSKSKNNNITSYTMPTEANTEIVEDNMEAHEQIQEQKADNKAHEPYTMPLEYTGMISDDENRACDQEYQCYMNEFHGDSSCFNDIDPMQGQFDDTMIDQQLAEYEEIEEFMQQEDLEIRPKEPFMPINWVPYNKPTKITYIINRTQRSEKENKNKQECKEDRSWDDRFDREFSMSDEQVRNWVCNWVRYNKPTKIPYIINRTPRVPKENKNKQGYKADGAWDVRDRFDRGYIMSDEQVLNWVVNVYYKFISRTRNKYPAIGYESFNVAKVKYILDNIAYYRETYPDIYKISTINKLKKLLVIAPNGYMKTYYQYSSAYRTSSILKNRPGNGRLFAVNFIGLQNLKREVRAEICHKVMCEVDLENCHFRIIARIAGQFNINLPVIMDYISNREDRLQELVALNPAKTRGDIKETLLAILNGGKQKMEELHHNQFIVDLYNECIDLRDAIVQKDPGLYYEFKRINSTTFKKRWDAWNINEHIQGSKKYGEPWEKNAVASTLSHYLLSEESRIIEVIRSFYTEKNVIKNDGYMNCFDGIYLPYDTTGKIARLVPELQHRLNDGDTSGVNYIVKMKNVDSPMFDSDRALRSKALETTYDAITKNGYSREVRGGGFKRRMNAAKGFCRAFIKMTGLGLTTATMKLRQRYLPAFKPLMDVVDILFVRSIMGSGKTYNTYKLLDEMIEENKELRVLVVSFRRTIEKKYGDDLKSRGFENYMDIKEDMGFTSERHPRLIVQINSLKKVTGSFDLVILDEVSYTIDTIFGYCEEKEKVYRNLKYYIKDTKKLIFLDAYLTDANVNFVKAIRPDSPMIVMENRKTQDIGRTYVCDYGQFLSRITTKLNNNKKIIIASTSKDFIDKRLKALLDDKFTGTDKKYLLITSDAIPDTTKEEQDEIRNKKNWGKYDVVAYTPTVTAGISYEEEGVFDSIFGYFNNRSASADIAAQMLSRVRHPMSRDYNLFFKEKGDEGKFDTSEEGLDTHINKYIILGDGCLDPFTLHMIKGQMLEYNPCNRVYTDKTQYDLLKDWFKKKQCSYNNFGAMLLYYLNIQGYPWASYDITDDEYVQTMIDIEENSRIIKEATIVRVKADHKEYLEAPDICWAEMRRLSDKERKTKKDKIALHRYTIDKFLGDKILEQVFEDKPKELQALLRNTTNLYMDRNDVQLFVEDGKVLSDVVFERVKENVVFAEADQHIQKERDFWFKKYISLMVAKGMGFDNHNDYTTTLFVQKKDENTRELKEMDVEGIMDIIKEHKDVILLLFGNKAIDKWEEEIRKYKVTTINALLKHCGRKIVINGGEVRLIPLFTPLTIEEAPHLHQADIKAKWTIQNKKDKEADKKKQSADKKEARRIRRNAVRNKKKKEEKEERKRKRAERKQKKKEEKEERRRK